MFSSSRVLNYQYNGCHGSRVQVNQPGTPTLLLKAEVKLLTILCIQSFYYCINWSRCIDAILDITLIVIDVSSILHGQRLRVLL